MVWDCVHVCLFVCPCVPCECNYLCASVTLRSRESKKEEGKSTRKTERQTESETGRSGVDGGL